MNYRYFSCAGLYCLLLSAVAQGACASDDLWNALEAGGKVVLMRHAPVESGPENGDPLSRDPSCKNERNLSNQGRLAAEVVGKRFAEHNIPISKVLHSPFCRTADTAHIAFGDATPANYLSLLEILDADDAAQQTEELSRVIGSYSGDGNLVLVTHEPNIRAVSFELMKHLDLLVIKPKADSAFDELGVIRFSEEE